MVINITQANYSLVTKQSEIELSVSSVCMRHVHVRTSYNWQKRGTDNIESYEYDKLQGIQA